VASIIFRTVAFERAWLALLRRGAFSSFMTVSLREKGPLAKKNMIAYHV